MNTNQHDAQNSTSAREIVATRLLDAPRELVFDVWTDPKHIDKWWGPNGFSNATSEMAAKPGGVWRFTMTHAKYGTFQNQIVFHEVVRPERLVYTHGSGGADDTPDFDVTVTFADEGGKTRLTMRSLFVSPAEVERVKKFGAVEGGQQTLAKLAQYLESVAAAH